MEKLKWFFLVQIFKGLKKLEMKTIETEQIQFFKLIIKHLYSSGQIVFQAYLMNRVSLAHKRPEILILNRALPSSSVLTGKLEETQCRLRTEVGVRDLGLIFSERIITFLWMNHNFALSRFIDLERVVKILTAFQGCNEKSQIWSTLKVLNQGNSL